MAFSFHNGDVYKYLNHLGKTPEPGKLQIVAIRGAVPYGETLSQLSLRENIPNLWNDTIALIGPEFLLFQATVDPGSPKPGHSPNPKGMAHVLMLEEPAGKILHFKKGMHHNTYPCLVQAEDFTVARYNSYPPPAHPTLDKGQFGIHTHWGGLEWQVGNWSEGCLVIFGGNGHESPWELFWDKIQHYLPHQDNQIPAYPIQGNYFARFLGK